MPAIITADLSGHRKELRTAICSLLSVSAVDTLSMADSEGFFFFIFFFMITLFIFLAFQQSGAKITSNATSYIWPTKPDYGIRYLYAQSIESCSVITAS